MNEEVRLPLLDLRSVKASISSLRFCRWNDLLIGGIWNPLTRYFGREIHRIKYCNVVTRIPARVPLKQLSDLEGARRINYIVDSSSKKDPLTIGWTHWKPKAAISIQPECAHCQAGAGPFKTNSRGIFLVLDRHSKAQAKRIDEELGRMVQAQSCRLAQGRVPAADGVSCQTFRLSENIPSEPFRNQFEDKTSNPFGNAWAGPPILAPEQLRSRPLSLPFRSLQPLGCLL